MMKLDENPIPIKRLNPKKRNQIEMTKKTMIEILSGTIINGIQRNNYQYGPPITMMFMGTKSLKRKTYNRGVIDGRVEMIDEIEWLIIKLMGEDYLRQLYKQYNIEYQEEN